jgi:hypothetical protein
MSRGFNASVTGKSQFTVAYLGWMSFQWQLLEEVDRQCARGVVLSDRLLQFKLECQLLEEALPRLSCTGVLRCEEQARVQSLLQRMRMLLDLGQGDAPDQMQSCVRAVQNGLYEEVRAATRGAANQWAFRDEGATRS